MLPLLLLLALSASALLALALAVHRAVMFADRAHFCSVSAARKKMGEFSKSGNLCLHVYTCLMSGQTRCRYVWSGLLL